jgi:hypothetical protein
VGKVYHIPSDAGRGRMSVMPADRPTPLPAFLHSPTWKEDCAGLSGIDTIESLVD